MRNLDGEMRTAALDGNVEKAHEYLSEGADVNSVNRNEDSALHLATYNGHVDMVRYLVSCGANTQKQNRNGQTPLQLASVRGYLPILKYFTDLGVDIHTQTGYSCMSALHLGSKEGHPQICQLLLDCGGDEDMDDYIENIAEYYAANYPTELVFKKWKDVPVNKKQKLNEDYLKKGKKTLRNGVLINAKPIPVTGPREPTYVPMNTTQEKTRREESRDHAKREERRQDKYESEPEEEEKEEEEAPEKTGTNNQADTKSDFTKPSNGNGNTLHGEDATDKNADSSDWDSDEGEGQDVSDQDDADQQGDGSDPHGAGARDRARYPGYKHDPKKIPKYKPREEQDRDMKRYGYKRRGGNWNRLKDHEFEWSEDYKKRQALKVWERLGGAGGGGGGGGGAGGAVQERGRPEGVKTSREPAAKQTSSEPRSHSAERPNHGSQQQPQQRNQYNRAKSLERTKAEADAKKYGYKRNEAHWQKLKDHEFDWSEDFKKRQNMSVFDRLKGAAKKDTAAEPVRKEPQKAQTKRPEPPKPQQSKASQDPDPKTTDATPKTTINARHKVDTWRTPPKKKAMADVVVNKVVGDASKDGEGGGEDQADDTKKD